MNRLYRAVSIAVIPALMQACSLKEEEPEGVIPEGFKNAVNKAENVEGLLQDSKKNLDETID